MGTPTSPSPTNADQRTPSVADVGFPLASLIDEVSSTTTYVCEAQPGTPTSTAAWRISKIVVTGTVTQTTWALGSDGVYGSFTVKADDRLTQTYA